MKNMYIANYGNYVAYDNEPEWMRTERYDYCEDFFVKNPSPFSAIQKVIMAALHLFV